jgi:hypothetical protein
MVTRRLLSILPQVESDRVISVAFSCLLILTYLTTLRKTHKAVAPIAASAFNGLMSSIILCHALLPCLPLAMAQKGRLDV